VTLHVGILFLLGANVDIREGSQDELLIGNGVTHLIESKNLI
jgi:hypothetical protein